MHLTDPPAAEQGDPQHLTRLSAAVDLAASSAWRASLDRRAIGRLGHADLPPRPAFGPDVGVGLDDDHRRAIGRARPVERLAQLVDRGDRAHLAAERGGVGGEVDADLRRPVR